MPRKHDAHKDELEGVAQRLRDERPQASPLDLDRIKTTAMSRAKTGTRRGRAGARRLAVASLTVGLMAAGTGSVIAGVGSDPSKGSAASAQYGSNCDTNNGNGTKIGSGNGNNNGNENGNTTFASFRHKGKDKGGTGNGNTSSGNGTGNGNSNGTGNGNESGNENNNYNCNENSFNTTTNTVTNNITNSYNGSTVTVTAPANSGVLGATTTKGALTSKHRVKFHINLSRKAKLKKVTLRVNGKVISILKGKKASANISIANLPCSATVTVTAVTSSGKTITQTHTYHLC